MPLPVFVPDVDGVPPVVFAPGAGGDIILAAADAIDLPLADDIAPQWGLYRQGRPVVVCDNVLGFDHKVDWAIADHPLERGSFESFNKVAIPFDVRLIFSAGGSESNRAALLSSLRAIAGDLKLYDAVTPETVYRDVNIVHLDYRRTAQSGAGLLIVAVWCQEIRQVSPSTGGAGAGSTAAPSGAAQENGGTVQPTDPNVITDQSFAGDFASGFDPNSPELSGNPPPPLTAEPIPGTTFGPSQPDLGGSVQDGTIDLGAPEFGGPIDVPG